MHSTEFNFNSFDLYRCLNKYLLMKLVRRVAGNDNTA